MADTEPGFRVDVITTNAGVISLPLTIEEARRVVETVRSRAGHQGDVRLFGRPLAPTLELDRTELRSATASCYTEMLDHFQSIVGHDEIGASWAIRTAQVVAVRVVDPALVPAPPSRQQVGFRPTDSAVARNE